MVGLKVEVAKRGVVEAWAEGLRAWVVEEGEGQVLEMP